MILRGKPGLREVLFAVQGSILPDILGRLLFLSVISAGAVLVVQIYPQAMRRLAAVPFTLIGLALSIFMSFRNNACYDRWWEARKLWGQLIIDIRSFSRQVSGIEPEIRRRMLTGLCGFTNGLAARLRDADEIAAIAGWVATDGPVPPNPTDTVLSGIGAQCLELKRLGKISEIHYSVLEIQLTSLSFVQASCERIKNTPVPFAYALLLHRTAYLFCLLLPFALAPALGWWTPLPVVIVGYAFFGLDALGDQLEDPFGTDANDLPLDAMVRTVERDLLFALSETELPPVLVAQGYSLS